MPALGHCDFLFVEHFRTHIVRFENLEAAIDFSNIEFTISPGRRSPAHSTDILLPVLLSRPGVQTMHIGRIVDNIDAPRVNRWRSIAHGHTVLPPDFFARARIQTGDATKSGIIDIFFTMCDINAIISHNRRGVDATPTE